jgi:hypothetical protein
MTGGPAWAGVSSGLDISCLINGEETGSVVCHRSHAAPPGENGRHAGSTSDPMGRRLRPRFHVTWVGRLVGPNFLLPAGAHRLTELVGLPTSNSQIKLGWRAGLMSIETRTRKGRPTELTETDPFSSVLNNG